jgi:hypothetical protein
MLNASERDAFTICWNDLKKTLAAPLSPLERAKATGTINYLLELVEGWTVLGRRRKVTAAVPTPVQEEESIQ